MLLCCQPATEIKWFPFSHLVLGQKMKPKAILTYNDKMGGVDLSDQQLTSYPCERKRHKVWYNKFFRYLLNQVAFNTYVLYKKLNANSKLNHVDFRVKLIERLLEDDEENYDPCQNVGDIIHWRPPHSKFWGGGTCPPVPPRFTPLDVTESRVMGSVNLRGVIGKSITVPLVSASIKLAGDGVSEKMMETLQLTCAVVELNADGYDVILPQDIVCDLQALPSVNVLRVPIMCAQSAVRS